MNTSDGIGAGSAAASSNRFWASSNASKRDIGDDFNASEVMAKPEAIMPDKNAMIRGYILVATGVALFAVNCATKTSFMP